MCPSGGIGRRTGLKVNLSAADGNRRVELFKFGEAFCQSGDAEPSGLLNVIEKVEGVETRRIAPKVYRLR